MSRRRWDKIGFGVALILTFVVLLVLGTVRPEVAGTPVAGPPVPQAADEPESVPAPWMRRLEPGERPPQFVLFSFDGGGSHEHWQRFMAIAEESGGRFSGFLSGIYLLPDSRRGEYTGPGHRPGRASIGFGGSEADVATLIADLNTAVERGHEIGTHYNGHFCQGSALGVGEWNTAQWNSELDQFFAFVEQARADGLKVDPASIQGGRTPCLEGDRSILGPVLAERGMSYDTSAVSDGIAWPYREHGIWQFPMPSVRVPGVGHKKTIMMDYNLWYVQNKARNEPQRAEEFAEVTLETYEAAYAAAFDGNRAPLVVGNHFNEWSGGGFTRATERFMAGVCARPETVCATYSEVIDWMALQDPAVLEAFRAMPHAQVPLP
ncbi:polysaccharide deacetylase [Actinokineospora sp. UTMC 2448]|uniref:polysaccharide deacetylase n=1 Tax=Actinokineospora sp. UTMC 2448 TaxID=2268449 RepID=UPI0021645322|nr:polysaccharide deacetylase [Actinokineospora sp. UTMC 2448]UVS77012.1 hypothetical protein Actkin_00712 [Actinokineospora sp. UTMC 2448]